MGKPWGMARIPKERTQLIQGDSPAPVGATLIWKTGKCWTGGREHPQGPQGRASIQQVQKILRDLNAQTNGQANMSELRKTTGARIQLPGNITDLTPTAKNKSARGTRRTSARNKRAMRPSVACKHTPIGPRHLMSVAPGGRNYLHFRKTIQEGLFPITAETISRRGATSNLGKPFGLYVNRVKMVAYSLVTTLQGVIQKLKRYPNLPATQRIEASPSLTL